MDKQRKEAINESNDRRALVLAFHEACLCRRPPPAALCDADQELVDDLWTALFEALARNRVVNREWMVLEDAICQIRNILDEVP